MEQINGVIFPGGAGDSLYEAWEEKIYLKALKMNDEGTYFPIMGICLGMQHITKYVLGFSKMSRRTLKQEARPLTFDIKNKWESRMFSSPLMEFELSDFETEPAFFHQHNYGITPEQWERYSKLSETLRIVSTDLDKDGIEFVNIYEGINYPIYGFQFHPEKATSAMSKFQKAFDHSNKSIFLNRFFADFFVNEAR